MARSAVDRGHGQGALKFYLEENQASDLNRLLVNKPEKVTFLPQTFDLADRSDGGRSPPRKS